MTSHKSNLEAMLARAEASLPILPPVSPSDAPGQVAKKYSDLQTRLGMDKIPGWLMLLGHNPAVLDAYGSMVANILTKGTIPPLLKELIIFSVSHQRGSPYCSVAHAHAALKMDTHFSLDTLLALSQGEDSEALAPSWKAALDFAVKSALQPEALDREDRDRLFANGYTEAEALELISVAGLAQLFNHLTISMKPTIDDEYQAIISSNCKGRGAPKGIA